MESMNKTVNLAKIEISVTNEPHAIPLIGLHEPYGEGEYMGHRIQVSIGGGCQTFWFKIDNGPFHVISLEEVLDQCLTALGLLK